MSYRKNLGSISFRFNAISLVGVTVLLFVFGALEYNGAKKLLNEELVSESEQLLSRIGINIPGLMWNFQTDLIAKTLDAELAPPSVQQILLFEGDSQETIFIGRESGEGGEAIDAITIESVPGGLSTDLVYVDDIGNETKLGSAVLVLDRTELTDKLRGILGRLILQTILLDFAVIIMLTILCKVIVINPINKAANAMENIAQGDGDLSQRLAKSSGEIGRLSNNFNLFVSNIQELVQAIYQSMEHIVEASKELSDTANNTKDKVNEQRTETEMVATATQEMSASAAGIADNANEASAAAEAGNKSIDSTQIVFKDTIVSVKNLAQHIDEGVDAINVVKDDVSSISSVLDVIGTIAEQTNLLALNAAIEAARAGEQGRGFAVVADEVRSLAQRTQESTGEVHKMLDRLRKGSDTAVAVIETGREQGNKTMERASSAENSLTDITDAVLQVVEMNTQISRATDEQTQVSADISQRIARIFDLTIDTVEIAESTAEHANRVFDLSTDVSMKIERLAKF